MCFEIFEAYTLKYLRALFRLWQRVREESGGSGRMGGEDDDGVRVAGRAIAMRKVCVHAGGSCRGQQAWVLGRVFRCWVCLIGGRRTMR